MLLIVWDVVGNMAGKAENVIDKNGARRKNA